MSVNRFTEKSQEALQEAQVLAERRQHQGVDVEHLAAVLLTPPDGLATAVLSATGASPAALRQSLGRELDRLPQVSGSGGAGQTYVTPRLAKVLRKAEDEAKALKDDYTSIEHLLLAMVDDTGAVGKVLRAAGVERESLMEALRKVRGHQRVTSANPEGTYQALERYGRDLTKLASQGKVDPVIGRDE